MTLGLGKYDEPNAPRAAEGELKVEGMRVVGIEAVQDKIGSICVDLRTILTRVRVRVRSVLI